MFIVIFIATASPLAPVCRPLSLFSYSNGLRLRLTLGRVTMSQELPPRRRRMAARAANVPLDTERGGGGGGGGDEKMEGGGEEGRRERDIWVIKERD